jgi:hypothetical protein
LAIVKKKLYPLYAPPPPPPPQQNPLIKLLAFGRMVTARRFKIDKGRERGTEGK